MDDDINRCLAMLEVATNNNKTRLQNKSIENTINNKILISF